MPSICVIKVIWKCFTYYISLCISGGLTVEAINGMLFNPIFGTWSWINDCSVNYALHAVKSKVAEQSDFVSESSNGKDNDSDQSESSSCSKDKLSKE